MHFLDEKYVHVSNKRFSTCLVNNVDVCRAVLLCPKTVCRANSEIKEVKDGLSFHAFVHRLSTSAI